MNGWKNWFGDMEAICVVDTDEWINLDKRYPRDIFSGLWHKIEDLISSGRILSRDKVRDEIEQGHDGLVEWIRMHPQAFRNTNSIIVQVQKIIAEHPEIVDDDASHDTADPYIIALAISHRHDMAGTPIIVTGENPRRPNRIPHVARDNGIPTCKLLGMIQREGWEF